MARRSTRQNIEWTFFTQLPDFGEGLSRNIHEWFERTENVLMFKSLQRKLKIKKYEMEENIMTNKNNAKGNPFMGCTIVATGKLENFTRSGINEKIISIGAIIMAQLSRQNFENFIMNGYH